MTEPVEILYIDDDGAISTLVVLADVVGAFAVHTSIPERLCGWAITHRASGLSVARARLRSVADGVARALDEEAGDGRIEIETTGIASTATRKRIAAIVAETMGLFLARGLARFEAVAEAT